MADQLFPSSAETWDIEAARSLLRARLDSVRHLPGFPIGSDDAIIEASLPPFQTACANPFLEEWIADRPGTDDEDYEDPGPFVTDISVGKGHAVYKAHSYPTKVPHQAIMRFILHYTNPGDVVLDGFSGSGSTGVAAQACAAPEPAIRKAIEAELSGATWGVRNAVLADLSPSASTIAAGLTLPVDGGAFLTASARILEAFERDWGWIYETLHNGKPVKIDYVVWSEVFTCPSCGAAIVFYDAAFNHTTHEPDKTFACESCGSELTKALAERRMVSTRTLAGDVIERIELRPVRVVYRIGKDRHEKPTDDHDLDVLRRISGTRLPGPVPTHALPFMHMTHERAPMPKKGFSSVHHFWGDRALLALCALWKLCNDEPDARIRSALRFWIEQALWGLSWQNRYQPIQQGKVGGSQVNRQQTGVYYVPSLHSECSVRYNLEGSQALRGKRQSLGKLWDALPSRVGSVVMATGSSVSIGLSDNTVDYVFVDPPFGSNIYYADLAYLVESWLGIYTNPDFEAIVNQSKVRTRLLGEYGSMMAACFGEFFRVLKPGRWMTVEFSNSQNEVWLAVQRALEYAGFVVADTRVLDKEHLSYRQVTASSAAKKDLVISCYKPAYVAPSRDAIGDGDPQTAWDFTREHLQHLPNVDGRRGEAQLVRERMSDRLYDRMVAFHVSRRIPVPVTTTEYFTGLEQRFRLRDGMHFLDEQVERYERHRMTFKELGQLELFITNESSAVQWLRQYMKGRDRPLSYAEIQPAFFTELQSGLATWEELPELRELLAANFLEDDQGRWYVPDPIKAADLEKVRRRALLREFDGYTSGKGLLTRCRSEAVRAGFDDAWDRGDYGMIVRMAKRLPDDLFLEDATLRYFVDNAELLVE